MLNNFDMVVLGILSVLAVGYMIELAIAYFEEERKRKRSRRTEDETLD